MADKEPYFNAFSGICRRLGEEFRSLFHPFFSHFWRIFIRQKTKEIDDWSSTSLNQEVVSIVESPFIQHTR
jgi:hypothetical protein